MAYAKKSETSKTLYRALIAVITLIVVLSLIGCKTTRTAQTQLAFSDSTKVEVSEQNADTTSLTADASVDATIEVVTITEDYQPVIIGDKPITVLARRTATVSRRSTLAKSSLFYIRDVYKDSVAMVDNGLKVATSEQKQVERKRAGPAVAGVVVIIIILILLTAMAIKHRCTKP